MAGLKCSKSCCVGWMKDNRLLLLTIVGVIIGFVLAVAIKPYDPSDDVIMWIGIPGELFLRGLKCSVIPLVMSTVISAVGSLDRKTNGKLGLITMIYILSVSLLAPITGVILTLAIKPGSSFGELSSPNFQPSYYESQDIIADLFRNIFTDNIVLACLKKVHTEYDVNITTKLGNGSSITPSNTDVLDKWTVYGDGTNMLGILVFSIVFGMALGLERESTRKMLEIVSSLKSIIFCMLTAFIWCLPVGTASLIAKAMLLVDDVGAVFQSLGLFAATVLAGLCIHVFVTLPLIYFVTTRRNPFKLIVGTVRCCVMGMVIKSSTATMPEIFRCCEQNNHFRKQITSFCIPLNIAFKTDGSALFIASSSLWLAQTANITPTVGQVVTITIISWTLSMCLPSVPSASLVAIATVVGSTGIPFENIALLVAMEWLLDAVRTAVNIISDCICTGIVDARVGSIDLTSNPVIDREEGVNLPDTDTD
ncbi:excitatory amino acid transporter 3-like isoform X2 [Glandiceps talaboti]